MSTSATAAVAERGDVQISSSREGLVLFIVGLSLVLNIMNTMMFNLALPSVAHDFRLSPSTTSWIVTGYSIVIAISAITYSRLSDFIPIRRLLSIALVLLSAASIVGVFSNSFLMLLIVRLVQASGAGAVPALSVILASKFIPLERRGKAMAVIFSASSLGLGLGPVVGGAVVQYWGWHYLFAITSIMLLLVPAYAILLPAEKPKQGSFDVPGAFFIGIGATGILLFITNMSGIALAAGLISLALFVIRIRRAKDPFVQPSLFSNRTFLILGAVGIIAYLCSFASLYIMPQILVKLFGLSAGASGLIIFPGSLLALIVSRFIGKIIDKHGNSGIIRYVPYLVLVSMLLFALFAGTTYVAILLIYMLLSVAFTFMTSSVSNEMSRILKHSQIGSGIGLFNLLQFFSGALGVAATASAITWQKALPLKAAYTNIFLGLSVIAIISIGCAILYRRWAPKTAENK